VQEKQEEFAMNGTQNLLLHTEGTNLVGKNKYSKIPLIQHPQDQRGAKLSNILDYQTVPICTDLCSYW
jgi:hypothetical protein